MFADDQHPSLRQLFQTEWTRVRKHTRESSGRRIGGELFVVCSDELGFRAANLRESGICMGSKEWCVFPETDKFDKLEDRVRKLEGHSLSLTVDVVENVKIRFQLVTSCWLPKLPTTIFRFKKLLNTPEATQLTSYTEAINR